MKILKNTLYSALLLFSLTTFSMEQTAEAAIDAATEIVEKIGDIAPLAAEEATKAVGAVVQQSSGFLSQFFSLGIAAAIANPAMVGYIFASIASLYGLYRATFAKVDNIERKTDIAIIGIETLNTKSDALEKTVVAKAEETIKKIDELEDKTVAISRQMVAFQSLNETKLETIQKNLEKLPEIIQHIETMKQSLQNLTTNFTQLSTNFSSLTNSVAMQTSKITEINKKIDYIGKGIEKYDKKIEVIIQNTENTIAILSEAKTRKEMKAEEHNRTSLNGSSQNDQKNLTLLVSEQKNSHFNRKSSTQVSGNGAAQVRILEEQVKTVAQRQEDQYEKLTTMIQNIIKDQSGQALLLPSLDENSAEHSKPVELLAKLAAIEERENKIEEKNTKILELLTNLTTIKSEEIAEDLRKKDNKILDLKLKVEKAESENRLRLLRIEEALTMLCAKKNQPAPTTLINQEFNRQRALQAPVAPLQRSGGISALFTPAANKQLPQSQFKNGLDC